MRLLLDTCTFLWIATGAADISSRARSACLDPDNDVFLSAASAWEIALKHASGKLVLPEPPLDFVPTARARLGIEALAIDEQATLHLGKLPALHKDPFDRLLVCQAIAHGLDIVTPDAGITQYPVRTLW